MPTPSLYKTVLLSLLTVFLSLTTARALAPQTAAVAVVPNIINFSGILTDLNGKPLTGIQGVTFLLYNNQQGGNPLWMETQNITPGKAGQYIATLGSTTSQGLPADIFSSGEARWLAIQVVGQPEQPRVLLVAVPYALKAADAQTIGGLPPSAFVLAAPSSNSASFTAPATAAKNPQFAAPVNPSVTGAGTANYIPLWDSTSDIVNSILFQSGTGSTAKIGVNTITPASTLDVGGAATIRGAFSLPPTRLATASKAASSQPFNMVASAYNSTAGAATNQTFQWEAQPAGNNTSAPSGTLNLLFGEGSSVPAETGLHIANTGLITFATGQTFPGTGSGTITGVTAGTDLTGGGTTGTVTLNLDTTKVPQLAANNTFTGTQTINNSVVITGTNASGLLQATNTTGTGNAVGVLGNASSTAGYGVEGISPNVGVYGSGTGSGGIGLDGHGTFQGVKGISSSTLGVTQGVYGQASSSSGYGVEGVGDIGVYGTSTICGSSASCSGGYFTGFNSTASTPDLNSGDGIDSYGGTSAISSFGNGGNGVVGIGGESSSIGAGSGGAGVVGVGTIGGDDGSAGPGGAFTGADNGILAEGIYAAGIAGFAANFSGDINVTGQIFAGTKDFKIDHPGDPANKYLVHASVESSEMMNIYTGNITTDSQGNAIVLLPDWFEVLNTDFRYQLTVIGQFAQAIISEKIENHQFQIRTSAPNVEVSWQVTGVRQDQFAKAHPLVVEQEKEARVRGYYIHPELFGAPREKQIEWARHPQLMKQLQQQRAAQAARRAAAQSQPASASK